jgi:hypothetical protein
MSGAEGAACSERVELERAFLAGIFGRGAPAFAELVGTPFEPGWLTGPHLHAFHAAHALVTRNEVVGPISATMAADEVRIVGGTALADQVLTAIVAAADYCGEATVTGAVARLASALGDLRGAEETNGAGAQTTRLLSVSDIFAPLPPINWLLEALDVAPGAPLLVAGYGFSGKTVSLQDLALAVATGTRAWGTFPVRAGRVLHVDYEQGSYLTRRRYQRLARARDIHPADLDGSLTLAPMPGWYLDGDPADHLERLCDGFDLAIVDSYRAACPRTDENSSDARIPLDRLNRISERTGVTFAVIHHARKPSRDSAGGARMSVRGSGALYDACGSVVIFAGEKGDPITVSHEKARITGRTHEDFLLMVEDVELDGDPMAGLRVTYLDAPTSQAKQTPSDRFGELKGRVLALVREEGPAVLGGVNLLRARLGGRKEDISAAVGELVRSGAIRQGGTYHKPTYTAGTDGDCK